MEELNKLTFKTTNSQWLEYLDNPVTNFFITSNDLVLETFYIMKDKEREIISCNWETFYYSKEFTMTATMKKMVMPIVTWTQCNHQTIIPSYQPSAHHWLISNVRIISNVHTRSGIHFESIRFQQNLSNVYKFNHSCPPPRRSNCCWKTLRRRTWTLTSLLMVFISTVKLQWRWSHTPPQCINYNSVLWWLVNQKHGKLFWSETLK